MNTVGILSILVSLIMAAYVTYVTRSRQMLILETLSKKTCHTLQMMLFSNGISSSRVSSVIHYNYVPFGTHYIEITVEGIEQGLVRYNVIHSPEDGEIKLSIRIPDDAIHQQILNDFLKAGWL